MKGKIIILLFMACFLTGCNATYKLEYINNIFNETVVISDFAEFEEEARSFYNMDLSTNYLDIDDYSKEEGLDYGYSYYDKSLSEENGLILSYKYNFKESDYKYSKIGRTVFPNMNFFNNSLYSGSIEDIFQRYSYLENITIEFKTDKYIVYHNADKRDNDTLFWYINKNNFNDKHIKIDLSDEDNRDFVEKIKDKTKTINNNEFNTIFNYIFIGIGVLLFFVFCFILVKFKNSNKK